MVRNSASSAVVAVVVVAGLAAGCQSTYYNAWEKLGYAKRDILVSRVKDARDEQQDAQKQFKTTLERFQEVTQFQGGDLEKQYKKLNSEYEASASAAKDVSKRIASVEDVAKAMFTEWEKELGEYQNADLKRQSQQQLRDTQQRYQQLIVVMKKAESRMQPVLTAFHDQVLFLKHNLNAQAIASLQTTATGIQNDVNRLIADMEASIKEADEFIKQMK
jgi:hypothetical protein